MFKFINKDQTNNMVIISLTETLKIGTLLKFKVSIKNPSYVETNGGFEVKTVKMNTNVIVEYKTSLGTLSTQPLNWGTNNGNLTIRYGWGVKSNLGNLPKTFIVKFIFLYIF